MFTVNISNICTQLQKRLESIDNYFLYNLMFRFISYIESKITHMSTNIELYRIL